MRAWLLISAAYGFLGVALGAFGAHALGGRPDLYGPRELAIFETAARYQMLHALALMGVAVLMGGQAAESATAAAPGAAHGASAFQRALGWAGLCFTVGTLVFSGSLYALVLTGTRAWGAVTPVGGLLLLAGWAALGWGAWRSRTPIHFRRRK